MALAHIWFILIAILWIGYLVLEGFDFGVGMLMKPLARDEVDRRLAINTIGPIWDGNEVWLLTAGGATFAAFPHWYATMFSGFYIPLFIILIALILRGVSFEYRHKVNSERWRAGWDWCLTFGSWVPSFLWGVAFGNLVRGLTIDAGMQYVGGFWALLNPFSILCGLATLGLFLLHGAIFLGLKTSGDYSERAKTLAWRLSLPVTIVGAAWLLWAQFGYASKADRTIGALAWAPLGVAALALVGVIWMTYQRREGWAFVFNATAIAMVGTFIFTAMFPNVMPAHEVANSLTIFNAASSEYTLTVMTWVAIVMVPIVLLYQGWSLKVFSKRLSREHIPTQPAELVSN